MESAPTRDTIIEVVVDDDWRSTVTRIPIHRAATGFVSSPNKLPAVHPPMTFAAAPNKSRPSKKK